MNFKAIIREIFSTIVMIAVIFIVIKGFYAFVMEPFIVDGRSMEYTLHDGERMFMVKVTDIERFDVVIFPAPGNEVNDEGQPNLYVKRVIGVPGDSIAYQNDQLILNGQPMSEPYLDELGSQFNGLFTRDFNMEDITGETVVPEGHYFVMGDNRRNSLDSRDFGFVDIDAVIGEANYVHWPLRNIRTLNQYELNAAGDAIVLED